MGVSPPPVEPTIDPKSIQGLKYFSAVSDLLARLHDVGTARDKAGNRDLFFDQYVSLILLYFFTPTLTGVRSIQAASQLEKVQKALGCQKTSLGSFSEAGRVFDAEYLKPILAELAARLKPLAVAGHSREAELLAGLTAVDGTLLPALPKMFWALWNYEHKRAAKLHLHFEVFSAAPVRAEITAGQACEKKSLQSMLEAGRFYAIDRGYEKFQLYQDIVDADSSFVGSVRGQMTWTVLRERELSAAARQAGVVFDAEVNLGGQKADGVLKQPYRVLIIERSSTRPGEEKRLVLVTNRMDLDADMIALAYRYRWQIELFFRWLKCVLGCKHLLSTSQNGVAIQVYTALIASLLITLWVGRKPTKRTYEMLCLYFQGWASLDELMAHINKLKATDKLAR
jgi:Transposase DDE domain